MRLRFAYPQRTSSTSPLGPKLTKENSRAGSERTTLQRVSRPTSPDGIVNREPSASPARLGDMFPGSELTHSAEVTDTGHIADNRVQIARWGG